MSYERMSNDRRFRPSRLFPKPKYHATRRISRPERSRRVVAALIFLQRYGISTTLDVT